MGLQLNWPVPIIPSDTASTPRPWPSTAWAAELTAPRTIAPSAAMYTVTGMTSPGQQRDQNHTSMPHSAATTTAAPARRGHCAP